MPETLPDGTVTRESENTDFTLSSYFFVRICDVATSSCLVSGSGYDHEPSSSSDFSGRGTPWSEHVQQYMPRIVISSKAAGYIDETAYEVLSESIHESCKDAATLGGRWVRIPFVTCERIPDGGAQLRTCRTTDEEPKEGVLVRAVTYVAPLPANPNFKWPPQGSPEGLYIMSGFLETDVQPLLPCESNFASLCALHNVEALLGNGACGLRRVIALWRVGRRSIHEFNLRS